MTRWIKYRRFAVGNGEIVTKFETTIAIILVIITVIILGLLMYRNW